MQVPVYDVTGQETGQIELADSVFGIEPNVPVMHQAYVRQMANARLGTHDTKTRGEVRGGGRKPWRQKGTGRARHGSIRSPLWRGGGVVFGPHPRKYTQRMPRKMRRLAIRSVLSAKMKADQVVVVEGLTELEPRTKAMIQTLARLPKGDARSTLILVDEPRENLRRGANNLEHVRVLPAQYVNMRDVLKYERLLLTREAVDVIHRLWAQ
ncbi:50S ribosomal protein L4 [Sphaerobacter thermophilus]|uniref:Large ribosomal subunit protein uL4 n=1 Tax=Sphaerobacter thermophilus (strain ATCC 49802 / DSM 20745 / KCCM 41009 / NCIMB 13125 / S 6022) TaxID=479434 RepID=D1C2K6_SPHTD|nr:50S ribosomal protein L4 [Sphaerobacter thermophilus]ACZ38473.1 ribosomal protein L4/L1e [Sphaerobacter thermophilus DSM 20745]